MGENMTNIHFAAVEMNGRDQPIFVTANVEDDPVVEFIGGWEDLSQFGKTMKFALLHDLEPTLQRHSTVRMFLPKLDERFAGDDVHGLSYISK